MPGEYALMAQAGDSANRLGPRALPMENPDDGRKIGAHRPGGACGGPGRAWKIPTLAAKSAS